jgi:hypothetical protein
MRFTLSLLLVLAVAPVALAATPPVPKGQQAVLRKVGAFSAIEVSGALDLETRMGKPATVRLEGDPAAVGAIVTEVVGKTLRLHPRADSGLSNLWQAHTVHCVVTATQLTAITATGACHVVAHNLTGPAFRFTATGASSAKLDGQVTNLTTSLSGACQVDAPGLRVVDAKVNLSGACHMAVNASKSLNAVASGASEVKYMGKPKVTSQASGASSVIPR